MVQAKNDAQMCTVNGSNSDIENGGTILKGTNPALKKSSNIPEIYAKMFGRFH